MNRQVITTFTSVYSTGITDQTFLYTLHTVELPKNVDLDKRQNQISVFFTRSSFYSYTCFAIGAFTAPGDSVEVTFITYSTNV